MLLNNQQEVTRRRSSTLGHISPHFGGLGSPNAPSSPAARKSSVSFNFDRKGSVTIPETSLLLDLEGGSAKLGSVQSSERPWKGHVQSSERPWKSILIILIAAAVIGVVTTMLFYPQFAAAPKFDSETKTESRSSQVLQKAFTEGDEDDPSEDSWPVVYIPGAIRSAVSSLSAKLNEHPAFCSRFRPQKSKTTQTESSDKQHINEDEFVSTGCVKPGLWKESTKTFALDATYNLHVLSAPEQLAARIPQKSHNSVKFIIVLREPVAMDFSHFIHEKASANSTAFPDYEPSEYDMFVLDRVAGEEAKRSSPLTQSLTLGHHADHLERYFEVFNRKNFLVLNYETLIQNQTSTLGAIASFLGIEEEPWIHGAMQHMGVDVNLNTPAGRGKGKHGSVPVPTVTSLDPLVCRRLAQYYAPHNERLYSLIRNGPKPKEQPEFPEFKLPCQDKTSQMYGVGRPKTGGIRPPIVSGGKSAGGKSSSGKR